MFLFLLSHHVNLQVLFRLLGWVNVFAILALEPHSDQYMQ